LVVGSSRAGRTLAIMKNYLKRHLAVVVAAGLGLAVVGGGVAAAGATTSRPTVQLAQATTVPGAAPTTTAPGMHHHGWMHGAIHGDILVKTKNGYQVVTFDRGTVTTISGTSITIRRPDGVSVTKTLTPDTKYKGISGAAAVVTGRPAIVVSQHGTALVVAQRPVSTGSSTSSGPASTNSPGS
jgi:hypothetical protein